MATITNYKAIRALQSEAKNIQNKMKVLETRRKTGRLNTSISFIYDARRGAFVFNAVYYGKFNDEGTYRNKQETKTSKAVWGKYIPRGRGRQGTGITPLHFTQPMEYLDTKKIMSLVKPILMEEVRKNVKKIVLESNKIKTITITK